MANNNPLLSVILLAYRQEAFVQEAVKGLFAQTYSPLEIILSDDSSPDGTFAIMAKLAEAYKGPHRVRLNQTRSNVGLCAHVNEASSLAQGALILTAAGDDISTPERVQKTFEAWEASNRTATSIWGEIIEIDEEGTILGGPARSEKAPFTHFPANPLEFVNRRNPKVFGASHAFSPRLMKEFGPLAPTAVMEDFTLGFRSSLIGALVRINEPIVKYRRHQNNLSGGTLSGCAVDNASFEAVTRLQRKECNQFRGLFSALLLDVQTAAERRLVSASAAQELRVALSRQLEYVETKERCLDASGFAALKLAYRIFRLGAGWKAAFVPNVPRLLPPAIHKRSVIFANKLRRLYEPASPSFKAGA